MKQCYGNIFNPCNNIMQYLNDEYVLKASCKDMTETETALAEKSSWDQANKGEKLDLVWINRKKISQIINDYLCLPFFLLIILWLYSFYGLGHRDVRS